MALSRRFLNLIVDNGIPALHRPDAAAFLQRLGTGGWYRQINLPSLLFNFQASRLDVKDKWKMDCFPLVDRRVICADQWGRSFLLEADTQRIVTMPHLHEPKSIPISIFVPQPHVDGDIDLGTLVVMEIEDSQIAVGDPLLQVWDCRLLPPPPYRTYCLDTTTHTWRQAGNWTLPFRGKVEYVPELKLWFGLSAKDQMLAAADLSSMDSQPELILIIDACKAELDWQEEWKQYMDSQLVNLGSGSLFFHTDRNEDESIAVLTRV
ncbi:hypothetical protein BRADI_1g52436v3 [Brachypodium distachyon]|uniref:Uncharacterized protein n=1 Tax=Brachypodium distachyon TaxID=15368 RepID=A0A0Q3HAX2_BRADI|nr:hypothetical protein BRADI_1g52436v3 [Brachypodium distachyon]